MTNIINLEAYRNRKPTDREKAEIAMRLLRVCEKYILTAQNKGVYKDWEYDGISVSDLINQVGRYIE